MVVLGIFMLIGTLYDILAVQLDFTCASTPDHVDLELSGIDNPSYSAAGPDLATITKSNEVRNGHVQDSAAGNKEKKPKQRGKTSVSTLFQVLPVSLTPALGHKYCIADEIGSAKVWSNTLIGGVISWL